MIFMPPRHGKSEQVTVRYPAYRLENDAELKIIIGAYGSMLANKFSRKCRGIARERVQLNPERTAADDWETAAGGGVRAAGVGGAITGIGGNLILIDDPVKNREEANSETYREKVWDWYRDDLYTRLEPGGSIILQMTRWHEDDLAGRILESEDGSNWAVLRLPAQCETQEERDEFAEKYGRATGLPDPLGREVGEALCSDRYPLESLADIKTTLGSYSYNALYQQRPTPFTGGMIPVEMFSTIRAMPAQNQGKVRYWDKAGTEGGGAYSAGVLLVKTMNNQYIIEDVERGQWSALQREQVIKQTANQDGLAVSTVVEQEPGSGGKESAESTIKMLQGFNVYADKPSGDKVVRAMPYAAQVEAGNVMLLIAPWNKAFIEENRGFPFAKLKDQIDAVAGAFNKLNSTKKTAGALGRKR